MSAVALVSVLSSDRTGLVAAIADYLFNGGINLRDANFAALGAGAEFVAVCELPDGMSLADVEAGLKALPELLGAEVRVAPYRFDPDPPETNRITHRITISGGDQLGLVARLADVFRQHGANVVRLEARKLAKEEGGLYVTRFAVSIAPEREGVCLATIANTAGSLGLACSVVANDA